MKSTHYYSVPYYSVPLPPPPPPPPLPPPSPPPPSPPPLHHQQQMFCPSPDVNNKAEMFIARFRAGLKLEKLNSIREKQQIQQAQEQIDIAADLEEVIKL